MNGRSPLVLGAATLAGVAALSGCGGSSNADRSYDCRLATPSQVAAATGVAVVSTEIATSDSGPPAIRACVYHFAASPETFAEVWSLRSGSGMYDAQARAASKLGAATPLRLPGVTGVAVRETIPNSTRVAASSYALIGGTYVNWLVIGAKADGVQAVTTLTRTAAAAVR